jgi:hypothetical protein
MGPAHIIVICIFIANDQEKVMNESTFKCLHAALSALSLLGMAMCLYPAQAEPRDHWYHRTTGYGVWPELAGAALDRIPRKVRCV